MNTFLFLWQKQQSFCKTTNAVKAAGRLLVLLAASAVCIPSQAQQGKSPVRLGDQYFAAGEYYTAAYLYQQYLHPSQKQNNGNNFPVYQKGKRGATTGKGVSRTAILYKQAESYRLANYWQEAAAAYAECMEKDPSQYPDAAYWLAVCNRSLGNYDAAEESLKKYVSNGSANAQYKEAAKKELETLQYIQQQLARPDSILVNMNKLDAPNSSQKGVFAPVHIKGNQFLVSSTQTDSVQVNGVNPHHSRLFYATINNDKIEEMTPLAIPAAPLDNQGAAAISPDGNHLYFSQWKKENGHTVSSIYYTTKQANGWSTPVLLSTINSTGSNSKQPFCTADGKYLFFSSDRPGGSGNFDIWYAPLKEDGTTGTAVNAGSTINTGGDEQAPFYHNSSSTLVFSSNGRAGMGGYDLFAAKGSESAWKPAENLGYPVNSSRDDIYFYANENGALLSNAIFSSDRGSGCCLETYKISKTPKSKEITGTLLDCKDNSPLANADVMLKDASGKTWKFTTDASGQYHFSLGNEEYKELTLTINKESYTGKTTAFTTDNVDETDLLKEKLISTALCIEKTPEPAPEPPLVIKAEDVVTVYFDFDKSLLGSEALHKLDSIYTIMVENPVVTIQISGYTDGLGSVEYNNKLSDRRARACAAYLVKKGIKKSRISFVSFGSCCPVEMELINGRDNPDGRSLNRRALINVKKE